MASDFERGTKKTIDLSVKAERMTAEILKTAMQEFLNGNAEKKGRMSYRQLQKKSISRLENIEIGENNIGDFLSTARKYDVDFALKKDKSEETPTYHVFFSADKTENIKRAFNEYTVKGRNKEQNRSKGEFTREQLKESARRIHSQPKKKHRQREKHRENIR